MVEFFRVKWEEWRDTKWFFKNHPHPFFQKIDRTVKRSYLLENPYTVSRKYLKKRKDPHPHQYGETLLSALYEIGCFMSLKGDDHLFELGSGRGRSSFFFHAFFGCQVSGIERIPLFVKRAQKIAEKFSLEVSFKEGDYLNADLSSATAIYLYGTLLEEEEILKLMAKIPLGARVLSVSYPLSDYDSRFTVLKKRQITYPWGETEVYLNIWDEK